MNAVITGASQGLGKEIARHFLANGANVAICARDGALLETTRAELTQSGGRIAALRCDVSSPAEVEAFAEFAEKQFGPIDVLINNAGVYGPMGKTEDVEWEAWRRTLEINLFGVVIPCRVLVPKFKSAKQGRIIVLSGGGATAPMPCISAYAASKAAVVRFVETLAEELREYGIPVNAVAPGALNTRMLSEALDAGAEKLGAAVYRRILQQKESGGASLATAAALCWYLATSQSDGITGKLISAQWDPWPRIHEYSADLKGDIYTLRRILPKDRGKAWGGE